MQDFNIGPGEFYYQVPGTLMKLTITGCEMMGVDPDKCIRWHYVDGKLVPEQGRKAEQ